MDRNGLRTTNKINQSFSPSTETISKCGFNILAMRANCTEWIVAFDPEPWKARMVGLAVMMIWW